MNVSRPLEIDSLHLRDPKRMRAGILEDIDYINNKSGFVWIAVEDKRSPVDEAGPSLAFEASAVLKSTIKDQHVFTIAEIEEFTNYDDDGDLYAYVKNPYKNNLSEKIYFYEFINYLDSLYSLYPKQADSATDEENEEDLDMN